METLVDENYFVAQALHFLSLKLDAEMKHTEPSDDLSSKYSVLVFVSNSG